MILVIHIWIFVWIIQATKKYITPMYQYLINQIFWKVFPWMLATESLFFIPLNNIDDIDHNDIDSNDDDNTYNDNNSNDYIDTSNDLPESWPLWVWSFSFPGPHSTALTWQWIFSPCAEQLFRSIGILVLFCLFFLFFLYLVNMHIIAKTFARFFGPGPIWSSKMRSWRGI